MSVKAFARIQMKLAGHIGRRDFDGAIRILEGSLSNTPEDVYALGMIANCHRWSNRSDVAITVAHRVLAHDSRNFDAIRLLSEVYAERREHDNAAKFARLGLENYPEPIPSRPRILFWILRLAAAVIPRVRRVEEDIKRDLSDPNKEIREWFSWANEYLAWYDAASGSKQAPTLH